ncbi:ABC transporter transmembrane region protein [Cardinium endosymbiont of Sogatella furcifera]|uniref:ABC transporter ATP-binding protein n=1 Tax=Cardinium endosymbiont of Sogatella furcifera TaxID=650378 RepID=UPI000E0D0606|nr:ABC transporter ATP-binding protein [Cardinium endosymbiont of Sogatella furcifera]AXI24380.1 ABC transporter transmembrane region protein [Cardinium endosymbiont of Sogatella furcifera]
MEQLLASGLAVCLFAYKETSRSRTPFYTFPPMQPITKSLKTFILHFVSQYKWHFMAMACFRMCFVLDNLVVPYAFKVLVTRLTELASNRAGAWIKLGVPLMALLGVIVLIEVLFRLFDYMKIRTIPAFEAKIRIWIVHYLQGHSYQFFTEHFSGDLVKRVNDLTDGISQLMMIVISSFLPTFCTMLAGVFSFAYIQPTFGAVLMAWLVLHTATYLFYSKKCGHSVALHAEKGSRLSGSIVDGFTNILSIKLFARNNQATTHLLAPQAIEKRAHEKALKLIMQLHLIISGLSIGFMGVGMLAYMIYYWQLGKLSISEVTYIFYAGNNICNLVWVSVAEFPDFFEEMGYCKQALKLLQKKHAVLDVPGAAVLTCRSPAIAFKDVSFAYVPGKPIFENQNIAIAAGEKVGLVGLSGSGKTTFINLLLRFFDLNKGVITIDGQDISTVTQESLRAAIALIPQDTTLFHDNILENIRYGRKEATDEEVIAAAQKAKCHHFIMSFSEGYDTLVGERGSKLSGGQRQRIAIARAILKDAPILILDEATSALDAVTETEIQQSLATIMAGKTTIVIAHRLTVLAAMDRVLVFNNGNIIANGSHETLLKTNAIYANMCRLQLEGMHSLQ